MSRRRVGARDRAPSGERPLPPAVRRNGAAAAAGVARLEDGRRDGPLRRHFFRNRSRRTTSALPSSLAGGEGGVDSSGRAAFRAGSFTGDGDFTARGVSAAGFAGS